MDIKNSVQYLNSPFELSIRVLFIMNHYNEVSFDINLLSKYDYIITRLDNFMNSQKSLHNNNPYSFSELITKRELLKFALNILVKKDLAFVRYTQSGVLYQINPHSHNIVNMFDSEYSKLLTKNIIASSEYIKNTDIQSLEIQDTKCINSSSNTLDNEIIIRGGLNEI